MRVSQGGGARAGSSGIGGRAARGAGARLTTPLYQLTEAAAVLPPAWTRDAAAVGSALDCHAAFERYREAGADELVLHGSTADRLERLVSPQA